jgi:hypothetical protein
MISNYKLTTYFYINRLYLLLVEYRTLLLSAWLRSVEGLLCGAEPRFELGPALQEADALLPEPRRTLN